MLNDEQGTAGAATGVTAGVTRRVKPGCVFCAIVSREASAHVVCRSDDFVAFLDTRPLFPGHVLLIPATHVATYDELPRALAEGWVDVSQRLQRAVEHAMESQGSLLIVNNVVSQSVPHLHLHIIPRTKGDGLRFWLGPRHPYADADAAESTARRIREALKGPPVSAA